MLKKALITPLAFIAASLSFQATAAFLPTDWKLQGDSLATLDTESGLEWLDLTQTDGKSINQVKDLLSTSLSGWRFPTVSEVDRMMRNFVGTAMNFDNATNGSIYVHGPGNPIRGAFSTLFGSSHSDNRGTSFAYFSFGLYTGTDGTIRQAGVEFSGYDTGRNNYFYNNYLSKYSKSASTASIYQGVWLVSDGGVTLSSKNDPTLNQNNPNAPVNQVPADVPVHAGFGLIGLLLMALGLRRRKSV